MTAPGDGTAFDWREAFPEHMAEDVVRAAEQLPRWDGRLPPGSIDSPRRPRGVSVEGQAVRIPYRQYHDALLPSDVIELSGRYEVSWRASTRGTTTGQAAVARARAGLR